MLKKLLSISIILCILFIVTGCAKNRDSNNTINKAQEQTKDEATGESKEDEKCETIDTGDLTDTQENNTYKWTSEMIDTLFTMKKDEILKEFGLEYKIIGVGYEHTIDGYCYEDKGLIFSFNKNGEILAIYGNFGFDIIGIKDGMNFQQIQDILGETEIKETFVQIPFYIAYKLEYIFGDCLYEFKAFDITGEYAPVLTIWEKDSKYIVPINKYYSINDVYIAYKKDNIFYALGEEYEIVLTGLDGKTKGYRYFELGMDFIFTEEGLSWNNKDYSPVKYILCFAPFEIKGVKPGMDFQQIQDILGETEIEETFNEILNKTVFELKYKSYYCTYIFISYDKSGTDSMLLISNTIININFY